MAHVRLESVSKAYGRDALVIEGLDLEVHDGEFLVLVGPSGCGKSTILRMIAGLEDLTHGRILVDGEVMNDVAPKDRDVAMIFQDFALYPHMSVFDNIAFSLRMRRLPREETLARVTETAHLLGIESLLGRKPSSISGGERQRVALGRALVRNPRVFLMDEPLSNLDAKLRVQMRAEIHRLFRSLNATFIYVTHDQVEAMTMGTRIVVLKDGMVQQVDAPQALYKRPANTFVASFIGTPPMNLVHGVLGRDGSGLALSCPQGTLSLPAGAIPESVEGASLGAEVVVGVRPEHIGLYPGPTTHAGDPDHEPTGKIEFVEHTGPESYAAVRTKCATLTARVPPGLEVSPAQQVYLRLEPAFIHLFAGSGAQERLA